MVTRQHTESGLREIGLAAGDTVVVHSSLSSFGEVEGGPEAVVDALLSVLGDDGTLIVPTFNFDPGVFDPLETPSIVGKITETVRKRPNAVRSLHPTHSVAAIGRLAEAITEGHDKTDAFGRGSALFRALQVNAKILQLGVTHTSNSTIHVAEEIAKLPFLDRARQVGIKMRSGRVVRKWIRRPGCSRGFNAIEEPLQEKDQITETMIGSCRARLMSARAVVEAAVEMLRDDPESLLCDTPDCGSCAEARAMVAIAETERQDQEVIELVKEEERTLRLIQKDLNGADIRHFDSSEYKHSPN